MTALAVTWACCLLYREFFWVTHAQHEQRSDAQATHLFLLHSLPLGFWAVLAAMERDALRHAERHAHVQLVRRDVSHSVDVRRLVQRAAQARLHALDDV